MRFVPGGPQELAESRSVRLFGSTSAFSGGQKDYLEQFDSQVSITGFEDWTEVDSLGTSSGLRVLRVLPGDHLI